MEVQDELKRRAARRRALAARRYRSRLFWRTISRWRRVIGLLVLAILLAIVGAAYYFTRPARIAKMAEEYLANLSGRKVRIESARFSPFEGIRLRKVRVWPSADQSAKEDEAIFKADEVLLETDPGSLLIGKLKVTRIVALRPELRQIEGPGSAEPTYADEARRPKKLDMQLPPIELREGRFVSIRRMLGETALTTFEMAITADLRPDANVPDVYHISGKGGYQKTELVPVSGTVWLNPFRCETNVVVVKDLQQLGGQIESVLKKYEIDIAKVKIQGGFDSQTNELRVQFDCQGTQVTLSLADLMGWSDVPRQAGRAVDAPGDMTLKLTDVRGAIGVRKVVGKPSAEGDELPPGQITFGLGEPGDKDAQPLTGKLNGQPFELIGRYDGFSPDATFRAAVRVSGLPIPQDKEMIKRLPYWLRNLWRDYSPTGAVNVRVAVTRPDRGDDVRVSGEVQLLDCRMSYTPYPYPGEHCTGTVRFDNKESRIAIDARHGPATFTIRGFAGLQPHWPLDVVVVGKNVPVDEEGFAALAKDRPGDVQALRALQTHGGQVDFTCRVTSEDRKGAPYESVVTIDRIGDVDMTFGGFNYPIRVLAGKAQPCDNGLKLVGWQIIPRHLIRPGRPDQPAGSYQYDPLAVVMLDGVVGQSKGGEEDFALSVASESLPLDQVLWQAMPPDVTRELLKYHIDARAELSLGTIVKKPGRPLQFDIAGRLKGGTMTADDFPYTLDSLAGKVRVTQDCIELGSFVNGRPGDPVTAEHGGTPIRLSGRVGLGTTQPTDVSIRCDRMLLEKDLHAAITPEARKTWDQFHPSGSVGIDARLRQAAASQPQAEPGTASASRPPSTQPTWSNRPPMVTEVTVTAQGLAMRYDEFPLPLSNVNGQMVILPDRVEIKDMTDDSGGRFIKLSGVIYPGHDNLKLSPGQKPLPMAELKISARNMRFDETLRRAVPWQVRKMWNDVLPAGEFDLDLPALAYTPLAAGVSRWDYTGRLDIRNGHGTFGVTLDRLQGQISGRGAIIPGKAAAFVGEVNLREATVFDRPINDLTCNLILDGAGWLRLEKLTGRLYGGSVDGFAAVRVGDADLPYRLRLNGHDIDIEKLVNSNKPEAERIKLAGRLEGEFEVEGKAGSGAKRGKGEVTLTQAQIYQVPVILPLFKDADKKPTGANQMAEIIFYVDGDRLLFEQADVRDPAIYLRGVGTMDLATKNIDLMFVADPPSATARGGEKLLQEIISGAGEELIRYHISGPLSNPKVEAISLHALRDAIEDLLRVRKNLQKPTPPPARRPSDLDTAPLPPIPPSTPGGR